MKPCRAETIKPLVVRNLRGDRVSFPGGVHRALRPVFLVALKRAQKKSGYILRSGQCWGYNCRKISGSDAWSMHAYGWAVDVNAPSNGRGGRGDIPRRFIRTMKFWGFAWGGDWSYTDPMHFEWRFSLRRARRRAREAKEQLR